MKEIVIIGGKGQLGQCLQEITQAPQTSKYTFIDYDELDITNQNAVAAFFTHNNFDYCINCAAYTAVDKAEKEKELAYNVNVLGAKNLAKVCSENNIILIHISTDFVFDGTSNIPYKETDKPNPLSIYGKTKLEGEAVIQDIITEFFIIRTSWLYSEYGNNFMKTMLRLGAERNELGVISDQIGSPTYAKDLAKVIIRIIETNSNLFGIYHYSNEGAASWYDFAKVIFDITATKVITNAIPTTAYPTPAKRPHYSLLDKTKIKEILDVKIPYWRDSLKTAISNNTTIRPSL